MNFENIKQKIEPVDVLFHHIKNLCESETPNFATKGKYQVFLIGGTKEIRICRYTKLSIKARLFVDRAWIGDANLRAFLMDELPLFRDYFRGDKDLVLKTDWDGAIDDFIRQRTREDEE